jgi:ABC-type phosphate transport system substrate-binding protein
MDIRSIARTIGRKRSLCTLWVAIALAVLLGAPQTASASEIMFVVNPKVRVNEVSLGELREIFLGDVNSLAGARVNAVFLQKGPVHELFLKTIGKTQSGLESVWRLQVFTGKGLRPRSFADEDAAIAYIVATPGAIGYVGSGKPAPGIKVLKLK